MPILDNYQQKKRKKYINLFLKKINNKKLLIMNLVKNSLIYEETKGNY